MAGRAIVRARFGLRGQAMARVSSGDWPSAKERLAEARRRGVPAGIRQRRASRRVGQRPLRAGSEGSLDCIGARCALGVEGLTMKHPMMNGIGLFAAIVLAAAGSDDEKGSHVSQNEGGGGAATAGSGGVASPGDSSAPDGAFAGAADAPKMTEIPIPDNCQHPGFPGGDQHYDFDSIRAQLIAMKPDVEARQASVLADRYDLSDQPSTEMQARRAAVHALGDRRAQKTNRWFSRSWGSTRRS